MKHGFRIRGRPAALAAALCAGLCAALALPGEAPAAELDLEGSWYVLIHYRDSATANPETDRWADRLWTFERRGSRLHWTEYPIVVFGDSTGRFERLGRNPRTRVLHAWEPNAEQRAEIAQGLQVNRRGSKTKSLRAERDGSYRSKSRGRSFSATTIGYQETWSIENPTKLPVFTQDDVVGTDASLATGASGNSSGRTRYSGLEVSGDGRVVSGRYERDEHRRGRFRMMRAGAPRQLQSDGRSPNEKQRDRAREMIRAAIEAEAYAGFLERIEADGPPDLREKVGEAKLSALWSRYGEKVIAGDRRAVEALDREIREAYVAAGDPEAARKMREYQRRQRDRRP